MTERTSGEASPVESAEDEARSNVRYFFSRRGELFEAEDYTDHVEDGVPLAIMLTVSMEDQADFFIASGPELVDGARSPWEFRIGPGGDLQVLHGSDDIDEARVVRVYGPGHWITATPQIVVKRKPTSTATPPASE